MIFETPIENYPRIGKRLGCDLDVKRDDYFPIAGGGNKARKIISILEKAKAEGSDALVTAGAANSNHARVVAIEAARMGWKSSIIIHDREDYSNNNLLLMKLTGAKLTFVNQENVKEAMDIEMLNLKNGGFNPYYIWGGGHSLEGSLAYFDCFNEINNQIAEPYDYIIHASGTGATQAGLHFGTAYDKLKTKVLGISISRNETRAKEVIEHSIKELALSLKVNPQDITKPLVNDSYIFGGYAKFNNKILDFISEYAKFEGLILDPIYTGKAFYGMVDLIKKEIIPQKSKVLFLHTGGGLNLFKYFNKF